MIQSIETLSVEVRYDSDCEVFGEPITLAFTDYKREKVTRIICSPERAEKLAESLQQAAGVAKRVRKGMGRSDV